MPTRTERLASKTFLAKLSRRSDFRKQLHHDSYNAYFTNEVPDAVGYRTNMKIKEKKEWAAAVSWVTFYGKDKARLEALHIDDLRTLANMYGVSTSPTTESGGD